MHGAETVLALVAIVALFPLASIARHKMRNPVRSIPQTSDEPEGAGNTLQLREEVKALKERLQVLERITVDKENSLATEIDALREL